MFFVWTGYNLSNERRVIRMNTKKLPVGIENFEEIRRNDFYESNEI